MTITFQDTNPDIIKIERGRTYYVSAHAGDLTIKRKSLSGSYVEVEGSPVTDGQEKFLLTFSSDDTLEITPSTLYTELVLEKKE
jgi:hypothetical protein